MQKLRGSAFLPVVPCSVCAQFENWQAREAAHAVDLVGADLERLVAGSTKISVESGVRSASVKPWPTQLQRALAVVRRQIDDAAARADVELGARCSPTGSTE